MGLFNKKTALIGLTAVFVAGSLMADQVLDETFDDNEHEMEQYWYYYDDNAGVGENDRPEIDPDGRPTVIDVPFTVGPREAFDNPDDTWEVKTYTIVTGDDGEEQFITMPYTMGEEWEASYCQAGPCATPFCGTGAMLAPEGSKTDLTPDEGVSHPQVRFKIRSRVESRSIRFKAQTLDIDEYSDVPQEDLTGDEFGYYGHDITTTAGEWEEFIIDLDTVSTLDRPLALPGTWAAEFDFDITQVTKFAWEVAGADGDVDTIDIADVEILGITWVSPRIYPHVEDEYPADRSLYSDFETLPYNETPLKYYWYAYDDGEIEGTSMVLPSFATKNDSTGLLNLVLSEGNGHDGEGRAAALQYELGIDTIPQGEVKVQGFVGVGCNLYDSAKVEYWDATAAGAESIFFEYYTVGNEKPLVFELSDMHDVADSDEPTRRDSRGSGIVYYRNLPPTNGEWRKVEIPFDSLIVNSSWEGYNEIPLDVTKLAKIQWKVQGAEGLQGRFAVDNIGFPGADFGPDATFPGVSVLMSRAGAVKSTMNALYSNGKVQVKLNNAATIKNGTVSLVNLKGAVIREASISNKASAASISAENLSAGMYFLKLNAVDANGRKIQQQSAVNILK